MIAEKSSSVFGRLIGQATVSPEVARTFLQLQFNDDEKRRMDSLLEKSRDGQLTQEELLELQEFAIAGNLLSCLHIRAKQALKTLPGM